MMTLAGQKKKVRGNLYIAEICRYLVGPTPENTKVLMMSQF